MNGRFREDALRRGASELSMLCPAKRIAPHLRGAEKSALRTRGVSSAGSDLRTFRLLAGLA
jgi:hypothetical protein